MCALIQLLAGQRPDAPAVLIGKQLVDKETGKAITNVDRALITKEVEKVIRNSDTRPSSKRFNYLKLRYGIDGAPIRTFKTIAKTVGLAPMTPASIVITLRNTLGKTPIKLYTEED